MSLEKLRSFRYLPPEWLSDGRLYSNSDLYSAMYMLEDWGRVRDDESMRRLGLKGSRQDPSKRYGHDTVVAKLRGLLNREKTRVETESRELEAAKLEIASLAEVKEALSVTKEVVRKMRMTRVCEMKTAIMEEVNEKEDVEKVESSTSLLGRGECIEKASLGGDEVKQVEEAEVNKEKEEEEIREDSEEKVEEVGEGNEEKMEEVGEGKEKLRTFLEGNDEEMRVQTKEENVEDMGVGKDEVVEEGDEDELENNNDHDKNVDDHGVVVGRRKRGFVKVMSRIGCGLRKMVRAVRAACTRGKKCNIG